MPDLDRLHADAEEAQIFSEVARSQLFTARASARDLRTQWTKIRARQQKVASSVRGSASTSALKVSKGGPGSP
jgi:hypothetical protein